MKIISNFDESEKTLNYVLDIDGKQYNLSRIISLPPISNIFSSFQYNKKNVFIEKNIKDKKSIFDKIPFSKIGEYKDIYNKDTEDDLLYLATAFYMEDDISGSWLETIMFDFNKSKPGSRQSAKVVFVDNYIIYVYRYPGIEDQDHIDNNTIYTEYHIFNSEGSRILFSLTGENFDNRFVTLNLDPNNVVYHNTCFCYIENQNILKSGDNLAQCIHFVMDSDDICRIDISAMGKSNVSGKLYDYINFEVPEKYYFPVKYDTISNTIVYDIFGNEIKFKDYKEVLLTKIRKGVNLCQQK